MEEELTHSEFERVLRENVSLAPLTTLGIGGPARFFAEVSSAELLAAGVAWSRGRGLATFILGGGSNIVVADEGFDGLVVRIAIRGVETNGDGDRMIVSAGAGEEWDPLVQHCVERSWAGLECLSGIPGRVGATPIQNVGAYGQETSETLVSVEALDRSTGKLLTIAAADCEFGYRTSRFKIEDAGRFVITHVIYALRLDGKPNVGYSELARRLDERGLKDPGLVEVRRAVLELRRSKAMVIDALDPDSRSVGSFFVNPVVTQIDAERIRLRADNADAGKLPAFPQPDGNVKLSAAWLIERAGIHRGYAYGNVGISAKHALAIVNRGGGTAREVLELKGMIQERVRDVFGIELLPEPVFVGFSHI